MQTLLTGIALGESPRCHDGRLWFSDWAAHEVVSVDLNGDSEVITRMQSFPFSLDWLPEGRLLIIAGPEARLLRREPDGSFVTHADLARISDRPWNEIVVDGRGNTYVNSIGFDMMSGEQPVAGIVALVTPTAQPDGSRTASCFRMAWP